MLLCCNCIEHIGMFNILNNEGMGTCHIQRKYVGTGLLSKLKKKKY